MSLILLLLPAVALGASPTALVAESFVSAEASDCAGGEDGFVTAHGVNGPEPLDWALEQTGGAGKTNAIEIDLNFDGSMPVKFHHGGICDCSTIVGVHREAGISLCKQFGSAMCSMETPAEELLGHIANHPKVEQIAMVYIDSKVSSIGSEREDDLTLAGERAAQLLIDNLLGGSSEYKGVVAVGLPTVKHIAYLKGALRTFKAYGKQYYDEGRVAFSIDQSGRTGTNAAKTIKILATDLPTPYRIFNDGVTASIGCGFDGRCTYHNSMLAGAGNYEAGVLSAPPGVWTIDVLASAYRYIQEGVRSFMTNEPKDILDAFYEFRVCLATNAYRFKKATNDEAVPFRFDGGGCCLGAISDEDFRNFGSYRASYTNRCRPVSFYSRTLNLPDCTPCSAGKYCTANDVCGADDWSANDCDSVA